MKTIKIDGEIGWSVTARDFKYELGNITGDVTIEISSPGGSVYQGVEIFNAIKSYDRGEVTTVITSLAASMASYIALAGDKIKAYDNAVYMIHNASVFSWGDARALRKSANIVESLSKMLAKAYISKTGKSEIEIAQMMDDETYLFGDEILEMGFVDEMIASDSESDGESARALANESVKMCMSSYKEHFEKEDKEQIAAVLKDCKMQEVGTNPSKKEQIEIKSKGENMPISKDDFIALKQSDPEAFKALTDGMVSDAVAAETKRITTITSLIGCDKVKSKAIEDGLTVGDTAIELNGTVVATQTKDKKDFEDAAAELSGNDQLPNGSEQVSAEALAIEADDKKYYENKKGK